jgi:hypothetical protein
MPAVLHAVEPWYRAPDRNDCQRSSSIRRYPRRPSAVQVNGYQTACAGCFSPFPYMQPTDPRFGAVTQFSTGANSHYNGLQFTAMKRMGHGLQGQVNYTWSHCLDRYRMAGFSSPLPGGILSPLPGYPTQSDRAVRLSASVGDTGAPARIRAERLANVWHSGVPFSVLSTPYSANGQGIVQGSLEQN